VRRVKPRDHSRELKWLHENAHLYRGQHLAVSGDELLAHGPDFGEVFDRAKATGKKFLLGRADWLQKVRLNLIAYEDSLYLNLHGQ